MKTLKEKIVEMLACDEILDAVLSDQKVIELGRRWGVGAIFRLTILQAVSIKKYEEVIAFILKELDDENTN